MNTLKVISTVFCITTVLFFSCKTKATKESPDSGRIHFGSGGGFTGAVKQYTLSKDGRLWQTDSIKGSKVELSPIRPGKAMKFFKKLEDLRFFEKQFNNPGNIYYFIQFEESGKQHQLTWGLPGEKIDPEMDNFFKELMSLIKDRNPITQQK